MMALTAAILIGYAPTTTADETDHPESGEALLILVPLEPEANDEEIASYDVDTETGESERQEYLANTGMEEADLETPDSTDNTGTEGEYPKELPGIEKSFEYGFEIGETIPNKGDDQDSDFPETGEWEVADNVKLPVNWGNCGAFLVSGINQNNKEFLDRLFIDVNLNEKKLVKLAIQYFSDEKKYEKYGFPFKNLHSLGENYLSNERFPEVGGVNLKRGDVILGVNISALVTYVHIVGGKLFAAKHSAKGKLKKLNLGPKISIEEYVGKLIKKKGKCQFAIVEVLVVEHIGNIHDPESAKPEVIYDGSIYRDLFVVGRVDAIGILKTRIRADATIDVKAGPKFSSIEFKLP